MPTAKVNDGKVELWYELHGNGEEKAMFVMGLAGPGIAWLSNVEWFLRKSNKYQICIWDNRGVGNSSVPPGRYTTSMMAKDAKELADVLGWKKYHIVGISMGGMIAQEFALLSLSSVLSLTLAVTHSGGPGSFPPWDGLRKVMKNMGNKSAEMRVPLTVDMLFSPSFLSAANSENGITNRQLQENRLLEQIKKLPEPNPKGVRSQMMAVQTHSVGERRLSMLVRNRKFPILIITATMDQLVSPKASYYLNQFLKPDEFVVFENCGHAVNVERFEEFNEAVFRNFQRSSITPVPLAYQSEPVLHDHHHDTTPFIHHHHHDDHSNIHSPIPVNNNDGEEESDINYNNNDDDDNNMNNDDNNINYNDNNHHHHDHHHHQLNNQSGDNRYHLDDNNDNNDNNNIEFDNSIHIESSPLLFSHSAKNDGGDYYLRK